MRQLLIRGFRLLRVPIDLVVSLAAMPSALVLLAYRTLGSARLPLATRLLRRIGLFPIRRHYYEPLFDPRQLRRPLDEPRSLPGVDFRLAAQLELLGRLDFAAEFREFIAGERAREVAAVFDIDSGPFRSGDAEFLFQFVRHTRPATVIEIGSGSSTRIVRHALDLNARDATRRSRHVCIEPFEHAWLEQCDDIELLRERVEDSRIDWATELVAGDLLFIDSSHVIRPQGDVLYEYLDILPRLADGVFVHVHDIFSPRDYLDDWIRHEMLFWNEQYLLEATLGNGRRYEVVAALNLLKHEHFDELRRVCPYLTPDREPGSFYFRVTG